MLFGSSCRSVPVVGWGVGDASEQGHGHQHLGGETERVLRGRVSSPTVARSRFPRCPPCETIRHPKGSETTDPKDSDPPKRIVHYGSCLRVVWGSGFMPMLYRLVARLVLRMRLAGSRQLSSAQPQHMLFVVPGIIMVNPEQG